MKLYVAVCIVFFSSLTVAKDVDWIEVRGGVFVGMPTVEIAIKTVQPATVMSYRLRTLIGFCQLKQGTIEMLELNEEKLLTTFEIGKSTVSDIFLPYLCAGVRNP